MRACSAILRQPFIHARKIMESAGKPGSVEDNHSSGTTVTSSLKQPTRKRPRARHMLPYLVLLRVGFTVPRHVTTRAVRSYRTFSPLPATNTIDDRRYIFCGTFRGLAPPRRYLAPCPPEPGLSSRCEHRAIAWPTPRRNIQYLRSKDHRLLRSGSDPALLKFRESANHGV